MAIIKEETNARQVIVEAASLQRDLIESRGLAFQIVLPDGMPTLYLDRTRVRQVILNLLSNAARFTDQGTITLSARVEPGELRVSVTDTGIGIPPPDLKRVFEEFHQLEGSLSRRRGGSGLGLTLCKQFVELHGGRIWAESIGIPGLGTTSRLRYHSFIKSERQRTPPICCPHSPKARRVTLSCSIKTRPFCSFSSATPANIKRSASKMGKKRCVLSNGFARQRW